MKLPTDFVGAIIWLIDAGFLTISLAEATNRLKTGFAATAQKEGRDVTPEEHAIVKGLQDAADRRMRGGV